MRLSKKIMTILLMVMSSYLVTAKPTVDYCATCESISDFLNEMQHNQTDSIINRNLYKMCLKENDGSNSRVCVFLAATIQNTLKHISKDEFCAKINACPSNRPLDKPVTTNNERCEFCSELIDSFKSLLAENSAGQLKKSLNYYCELTGDYKEECQKNLNKNLDQFVDFVQSKMNSESFCSAIKSCHHQTIEELSQPSIGDLISLRDPVQMAGHLDFIEEQHKSESQVDSRPNLKNPLTCLVCRQVLVIVYRELHKNATRENVENLLAKACKTIHPKDKQKEKNCEENVMKNADMILQSFINNIPPDLVCLLTGMCLPGDELKPVREVSRIEDIAIENKISNRNAVQWAQNYKCYFCEKIVDFLFKEMNETKTREYIKHLLDKSCAVFKKEDRQNKCVEYVNAYTNKLIDLIEKSENPGLICNAMHMCPVKFEMVAEWDAKRLNRVIDLVSKSVERQVDPVVPWCKICQLTYPVLSEVMQIDEAKDRLREVAHNLCEKRILPINVENCKTKIDQYFDVITQVRNAKEGCEKLTLCPDKNESLDYELEFVGLESLGHSDLGSLGSWGDTKCTACKMLVKSAYTNLNKTIHSPATRDFISRACEHVHQDEFKEKCKVDSFKALEMMLNNFEHNLPPQQVCELMQYCAKKMGFDNSAALIPVAQSSVCNGCKSMFPIIHRILQNENVRETVISITEQVCEGSNKPAECKQQMNDLVNNLADEETADKACSMLCRDDLVDLTGFSPVSKCTKCQLSMLAIDSLFDSEVIRLRLNQSLENFCESRGQETATKCKHLVRSKLPRFYELVHNITDHDNGLCVAMGYCEKKNLNVDLFVGLNDANDLLEGVEEELLPNEDELLDNPFFQNVETESNDKICEGCKKVFGKLNDLVINQKVTKDELLRLLLKTCPKKDDACRKFYNKYINYFFDKLVRNTDPNKVCPLLKLCPDKGIIHNALGNENWNLEIDSNNKTTACKECQSAVTYLIAAMKNQKFVDFVMKEIQQEMCNPLKYVERKACTKIVNKYGPKVIKKLANMLNVNDICTHKLKLCVGEAETDYELSGFDFMVAANDAKCMNCQKAVSKLNDLRGESSKIFEIESICGDDSECSDFMFHFQEFFQADNVNRDPLISCAELNICLTSSNTQLLSTSNCKFGPAYWCLSAAHAESCNATQFCQQSYWQAVEN